MELWGDNYEKRGELATNDQRKVLKASKTLGFLNLKISSDNNLITKP